MKKLSKFRPSPAMVVACIALVVSLAGTSYAAVTLPRNSVGTKQLKRDAVTSIKIKNNAVTGADVLESSLAKVRFAKTADTATSVGADAVGSANVVNASSGAGLRKADIAAVVTTATFDPPSVPANSCGSVLGVVPGDKLSHRPRRGHLSGLALSLAAVLRDEPSWRDDLSVEEYGLTVAPESPTRGRVRRRSSPARRAPRDRRRSRRRESCHRR
jgi:hypothetical protein